MGSYRLHGFHIRIKNYWGRLWWWWSIEISKWLFMLLLICFVGLLSPTLLNRVNSVDGSSWTFTGHDEALTLLRLFPYIFGATVIFIPLAWIIQKERE